MPQAITNYLALLSWSHGDGSHASGTAGGGVRSGCARVQSRRVRPGEAGLLDHQHILALDPDEHERRFAARLPAGTPPQAAKALARRSSLRWSPTVRPRRSRHRARAAGRRRRPVPASAPAAPWLRGFRDLRAGGAEWLTPERARPADCLRSSAPRPASRRASCSCLAPALTAASMGLAALRVGRAGRARDPGAHRRGYDTRRRRRARGRSTCPPLQFADTRQRGARPPRGRQDRVYVCGVPPSTTHPCRQRATL